MIKTFEVRRRCEIGHSWREGGEPCPEAHLWRLSHGLVTGGVLIEVEMSEADFVAAVEKYAPDESGEIYAAVGVDVIEPETEDGPGNSENAPAHGRPRRAPAKKVLARAPEPLAK